MSDIEILPVRPDDRQWVQAFCVERWSADIVVVHGTVYRPSELPGFIAVLHGTPAGDERVGLVTYNIHWAECEIVTLDSVRPGLGVGSALVQRVNATARGAGCRRLWLVTTNDNLDALGFYQRRGFAMVAVYRDAVDHARRIKPQIPRVGRHGIPIRDEVELELIV